MQKYAIFLQKNLKINLLKIKSIKMMGIIFVILVNNEVLDIVYVI